MTDKQNILRTLSRGAYALQHLRIESGNRLCATFKSKLGGKPGKKEAETIDEEGQDLLKNLKARFKLLTEGVAKEGLPTKRKWKGDGLISDYSEAVLIDNYITLERNEATQFRRLDSVLEEFPVYTEFLCGVRGCGPAMSGVIIGEIDIAKARYPSSLWAYAGVDVVQNGDESRGRSRRKEHLREVDYIDKDGKPAKRAGITFNPFLKTKLVGVLGPCLIKANSDPYRGIYDSYKHRLENHPKWKDTTKAHRHNAAIRFMVKRFLCDLYVAWRRLEGLPVSEEYAVAKLGIRHSKAA
jgi:hypothetical protein